MLSLVASGAESQKAVDHRGERHPRRSEIPDACTPHSNRGEIAPLEVFPQTRDGRAGRTEQYTAHVERLARVTMVKSTLRGPWHPPPGPRPHGVPWFRR